MTPCFLVFSPESVMNVSVCGNGSIAMDVPGRLNGKGPPEARVFIGVVHGLAENRRHYELVHSR